MPHGKGTGLPRIVRSGAQSQHFSLIVPAPEGPQRPHLQEGRPEKSEEEGEDEAASLSTDSGDAVLLGHQVGGAVAGR